MDNNALLNPDQSPRKGVGVRRLNHVPLYIVGAVALLVCFLIIMVAFNKSAVQATVPSDHGGSTDSYARDIAGARTGFMKAAQIVTPSPAQFSKPLPSATPDSTEMEARRKAFYTALFAQSSVQDQFVDRSNANQKDTLPAPTPTITDTAQVAKAEPSNSELNALSPNLAAPTPPPNSLSAFTGSKDRWTSTGRVERPVSPYVMQTGWTIPAFLISAMESELPGMIIAQVSVDVYDSPSGRYLLIPKGSRLVGEYSNAIQYGQSRIFVAWERILFPDGRTLDIGAMPGADGQGETGLHDQVDNHFVRIFGSALLMSAITGGFALSQPNNNFSSAPNATSTLSQSLGQQLGTATSQLLERNLSIAPTLKIRQGFKLNVLVAKDLVFNGEYHVPNYSTK